MQGKDERYLVNLDVFEGPLDLLLHLIRKHELDIFDIPIAFVTRKYLEYLDLMQEINLNLAAEYLEMAAQLAYIKSRMMLPKDDSADEDGLDLEEGPDPRDELVRQLLEYQKYKVAADELLSLPQNGRDTFMRNAPPVEEGERELVSPGLFALMEALQKVFDRVEGSQGSSEISVTRISVSARIHQVLDLLRRRKKMPFLELFLDHVTRADVVVTFLAILEMTKLGMTKIHQAAPGAEIHIAASADIDDAARVLEEKPGGGRMSWEEKEGLEGTGEAESSEETEVIEPEEPVEPDEPVESDESDNSDESEGSERSDDSDTSDEPDTFEGDLIPQDVLLSRLESLIFVYPEPITVRRLAKILALSGKRVRELVGILQEHYENRGIVIREISGGFQFHTNQANADVVRTTIKVKPMRISRPALETLAIVAYRQPVTRAEVEDIRRVDSGGTLRFLFEHGLVRILGRKEEPGRPIIYGTSSGFLELFGLKSLNDLPSLHEFTELWQEHQEMVSDEFGGEDGEQGPTEESAQEPLPREDAERSVEEPEPQDEEPEPQDEEPDSDDEHEDHDRDEEHQQ